ncbi:MAG: hypothetical protein QXP20_00860 [Candidatus Bathyarchaeia archaeon]
MVNFLLFLSQIFPLVFGFLQAFALVDFYRIWIACGDGTLLVEMPARLIVEVGSFFR